MEKLSRDEREGMYLDEEIDFTDSRVYVDCVDSDEYGYWTLVFSELADLMIG